MTLAYVHETAISRIRTFDGWGILFMSVAIGALQMMLDRGERQDWFNSPEIIIEFGLILVGLWLFFIHMSAEEHPYIEPKLFKDRNFVLANVIGFVVFISLFSIMSLIPPFMQNLLNYPVIVTGLVLMPRGIGTMLSMMIVGRLSSRMDPRINMAMGLAIMALSMYYMSHFDTGVDTWAITWTGFMQGLGMGQTMVPLMTMAFSTLPTQMRTEGTGVYNLIRNIGGSIGISVAFTLLDRNTQINHQVLAAHINPYNHAMRLSASTSQLSLYNTHDLAVMNGMVTKQATMISFNNDFKLMMILSLVAIPLVFLMRRPKYGPAGKTHTAMAVE